MGNIQTSERIPLETLDQWVLQYEKDLLRLCCIYLRDWSAAEDAVQETFLKAYKAHASFRGESHVKTWLIQIALNQCRDMRRNSWYRYIDRRISLDSLPLAAPPPGAENLALSTAIMQLKPKYMEVVLLYFYEGYSMKEIAHMLHITEAAVSIRLTKAKQKLRTELEGGENHEK